MRFCAARWMVAIKPNNFSTFSPVIADVFTAGAYSMKKILARASSTTCFAAYFFFRFGLIKSHLFKMMIAGLRAF